VLAFSVSQTGDRRPKDSGGANHHYKMCKEITRKKTSKQIFLYSMMTTRMTYESLKRDNYRFTSRWELHVYSPWARPSPYLWRLICWCDYRSCHNWGDILDVVAPVVLKNGLPRMSGIWWQTSISSTTKSTGMKEFLILTGISSVILTRHQIDWSASCRCKEVGTNESWFG
jgi:hypothetical protein